MTYRIIEGPYAGDILDQPRAISATLQSLTIPAGLDALRERLREGSLKRVVLTGMGASLHSLYPLYLRLTSAGFNAVLAETAELVHSLPRLIHRESVIVAISQSGESAETVRLLKMNEGSAPIIGITNAANSSLAGRASACFLTSAGPEFSVACKTYMTGHMALNLLGTFLCGEDVEAAHREMGSLAANVSDYLAGWRDHVRTMGEALQGVQQIFVLARGASLGSAAEGSLCLKESVRFRSEGMSSAAFRHGPFEALNAETFAVVFAGDEATRDLEMNLLNDIKQAGSRGEFVGVSEANNGWRIPETTRNLRPIYEVLPIQMMTLALAAQRGIEAGRFTRVSKITSSE